MIYYIIHCHQRKQHDTFVVVWQVIEAILIHMSYWFAMLHLLRHRTSLCLHLREITPSYILHTCAFGIYLLGGGYLPCKKKLKVMVFYMYVNMFHYFKIPYFTCKFFTKFTYNEHIGPYFLSHVVLRFSPSDLPEEHPLVGLCCFMTEQAKWK